MGQGVWKALTTSITGEKHMIINLITLNDGWDPTFLMTNWSNRIQKCVFFLSLLSLLKQLKCYRLNCNSTHVLQSRGPLKSYFFSIQWNNSCSLPAVAMLSINRNWFSGEGPCPSGINRNYTFWIMTPVPRNIGSMSQHQTEKGWEVEYKLWIMV